MARLIDQEDVLAYILLHGHQPELLKPIRLAADKAIKAHNATNRSTGALTPKYSSDALKMATWLAEQVKLRYPYVKEPSLEQWADDIDKLVRCDKQPLDNVKIALLFSQQDAFWRQQVRSGANLRKHYEKLLVKAQEVQAKQGGTYKV
jgi:hypothetical protein